MGILWMLAVTGSTINVESLMGSIMAWECANLEFDLVVSYANDARVERGNVADRGRTGGRKDATATRSDDRTRHDDRNVPMALLWARLENRCPTRPRLVIGGIAGSDRGHSFCGPGRLYACCERISPRGTCWRQSFRGSACESSKRRDTDV